MEKPQTPVIGSIVLLLIAGVVAIAIMRRGAGDVEFCRAVLTGLVNGKPSVAQRLDWEHLNALGLDVGATYTSLPSDDERKQYRQAFVRSVSSEFKRVGGIAGSFRNWRVYAREPVRIVIAADYTAKQKTLLMTLPTSGAKKVQALQWQ